MMTATAIAALIQGVLASVPAALTAYAEIKAVAASGADPTPEQWASWNAAADAAADRVDAAGAAEDTGNTDPAA